MTEPRHAFFDYDGTLITGDSIYAWLAYYYRRRPLRSFFWLVNLPALALRGLRLISSHALKRVFLWPLSFEPPDRLDALAETFVRDVLSKRFRPRVLERLREHSVKGDRVMVISASCTFYLRHLAALLPPGVRIEGTEMRWKAGFLGFPAYIGGNLREENKITRLRALGLGEAGNGAWGYSDHHHDLPLLRFVEFPVCIHPTAKLRVVAKAEGWPVWE